MIALLILHIWFVSFIDKPEKSAPQLSERAFEQRAKWGIATDQMDYPVSPMYMGELRKMGVTICHKSRWFNGVTCQMDEETAKKVKSLKFVKDVELTRDDKPAAKLLKHSILNSQQLSILNSQFSILNSQLSSSYTQKQLELYNLLPLHEAGFEGKGILMTLCDGGFKDAQNLTCFRQKELELGHFDFTDDKDDFYGASGAHGTMCLSTVSGIAEGFYGAATQAQYYLMRSEEAEHESPKEMDNLVAALEKADSLGVNIFSVSLGYAMFDNSEWTLDKSDLDGKSTRASLAATIAARKGMLVCVAAGNEGNGDWKTICVPADADSILTVGAVDTTGLIGSFSSFGPSADERVKPDVCAVGVKATLINPSGEIVRNNGTSFSCPLMAGLAACLWSALPDENAMQIRERIIRSADRFDNPDYIRYGFGVPDAWKAYTMILPSPVTHSTLPVTDNRSAFTKVLRNGRLLIVGEGKTFDSTGQRVQ